MKKYLLISIFWIICLTGNSQCLSIIKGNNYKEIYSLFNEKNITVHFYNDNFAIITGKYDGNLQYSKLEEEGYDDDYNYFIHYHNNEQKINLERTISEIGKIIYSNRKFSIIKIMKGGLSKFNPQTNHGLIYFDESEARLDREYQAKVLSAVTYEDNIMTLIEQVNSDNIETTIDHLSSYTTRNCYSSTIISALNWIDSKFQSYGLSTSHESLASYSIPSFNVIAVQTGTTLPDEYVVVGGHADSYSSTLSAPGADDNASGVAGVLEIARILSTQSFNKTIIYCAFSGEEYGLFGSKVFTHNYKINDKHIVGYVNLDMIGYKANGVPMGTSLIYPAQAQSLADYYKNICSAYLPDFLVEDGTLIGGDSDHTSFNNAGYQGIFPFENDQHYSPYIHSNLDILGTSVNNLELAKNLTSAALATVASLANEETTVSTDPDILSEVYFNIFPNPATSIVNIRINNDENGKVEIFNLLGELVLRKNISGNDQVDISNIEPGTYFIKYSCDKTTEIKKIIVCNN